MIFQYSTDPWSNIDHGLSSDSQIYELAAGLYHMMETLAFAGILVAVPTTIIMIILMTKKREEAKGRLIFLLALVILICVTPGLLTLAGKICSLFL